MSTPRTGTGSSVPWADPMAQRCEQDASDHNRPPVTGHPYRSYRGLLEHLATLTRNQVRFTGTAVTTPMLTEPTSTQREAFDLIGAPIPLTLK